MSRRSLLRGAAWASSLSLPALAGGAVAQTRAGAGGGRVTQLLDMSASQQELSRDYSTGLRLAFAQLKDTHPNLPQLVTIETDGSAAQVKEALGQVMQDPQQLALLGTVGESLALTAHSHIVRSDLALPHIGPWLFDSRHDSDHRLLTFCASRERQLSYALQSLAVAGVNALALVYPDAKMAQDMSAATVAVAQDLELKVSALAPSPGQDLNAFARGLPSGTPFHLVFMGTSVELARFVAGLGQRGPQHLVVCLSGVDPNTFKQLSPFNRVPVVFTQSVPSPTGGRVALVRSYRQALSRFFDEAPSSVSLSGYVAGRYAAQMWARLGPAPTRVQVMNEVQQRRTVTLEEWTLAFEGSSRGSAYVTQMLLSTRGQMIDS